MSRSLRSRKAVPLLLIPLLLAAWTPSFATADPLTATAHLRVTHEDGTVILDEQLAIPPYSMRRFAVLTEGWNVCCSGESFVAIDDLSWTRLDGSAGALDFSTEPEIRESTTGNANDALRYDAANQRLLGVGNSDYSCQGNYEALDLGASNVVQLSFTLTRLSNPWLGGDFWELYVGLIPDDDQLDVGASCVSRTPSGRSEKMVGLHVAGDGHDGQTLQRQDFMMHANGTNTSPILHQFNIRYYVELTLGGEIAPPGPPQGASATRGPNARQITVAWSPSVTGTVAAYRVYRDGTMVAKLAPDRLSFVDDKLAPSSTHSYFVTASNGAGESDPSPTVTAATYPPPGPPRDTTATASLAEPGTVTIAWQPPLEEGAPEPASYWVYRTRDGGVQKLVGATFETSLVDSKVATGNYAYVVRAAEGLQGPPGVPATASVVSGWASAPMNWAAEEGVTYGEVIVSWDPPEEGDAHVQDYEIIDRHADGHLAITSAGRGHSFALRLRDEGQHGFWVRAVTAAGVGEEESQGIGLFVSEPLVLGLGDSVAAGHGLGPAGNENSHSRLLAGRVGGLGRNYAESGHCAKSKGHGGAHPETPEGCHGSIFSFQLPVLGPQMGFGDQMPSVVTISVGANDIEFDACIAYFMTNGLSALADFLSDPCNEDRLGRKLAAFQENMVGVLAQLRQLYGPETPISMTQYYNPFPRPQDGPCGVWMVPAALSASTSEFEDENVWRQRLAETQARGYERAAQVLGRLNNAIAAFAQQGVLIVPPPDFTGHDMCRGVRDQELGVVDERQVWAFAPEVQVTKTQDMPFIGVHSFAREFLPVPGTCDARADPPNLEQTVPTGAFESTAIAFRFNCFPHPTRDGQNALALAIHGVVAPDRPFP